MAVKKKVIKKKDDPPTPLPHPDVAVITPSIDKALLEWHDDLKKRGKVEVAANLLAAYNEIKTPKAKAVVEAIINGDLTNKEIVTIAQAIFSVLK